MFFSDAHYCKSTAVDYINSLCQISHESLPTNFHDGYSELLLPENEIN